MCQAVSAWTRKRRPDVRCRPPIGQLDEPLGRRDALLGIGATLFGEGRDAIAYLDTGHARSQRRHRSRDLEAQDHRVGHRMRIDPHADLGVGPVAAGIGHVDQHLARTGHRIGQIGQHELLGAAGGMDDDGFHVGPPATFAAGALQLRCQMRTGRRRARLSPSPPAPRADAPSRPGRCRAGRSCPRERGDWSTAPAIRRGATGRG